MIMILIEKNNQKEFKVDGNIIINGEMALLTPKRTLMFWTQISNISLP